MAHLPSREGSNSLPTLLTFPSGKEAVPPRLLLTFPLGKEAIPPRPLLSFLPAKVAVPPRLLLTFLPRKEAIPPRPLLSFLPVKETVFPRPLTPPRQGKSVILLGQPGRAAGTLPGTGHPSLPRRIAPSPGKTTSLLPLPVGPPKALPMKNLTISGSLTFPANP